MPSLPPRPSIPRAAPLPRRVREARARFAPARATFESWARARAANASGAEPIAGLVEEAPPSDAEGLGALGDLLRVLALDLWPLGRAPVVLGSPIGDLVAADSDRMRASVARVAREALRGVRTGSATEATAAVVDVLDSAQALLDRLTLVAARPADDHLGGLHPDAPFPSFRASAANRGRVDVRPGALTGGGAGEQWSTDLGGIIWPSAVVDAAGDLYVGHAESEFVALHADGRVKWRHHDEHMMYVDSTGALGVDGWLYTASTDVDPRGHQNQGRLWKIDPTDGSVAWTFWGTGFEDPEHDPKAHKSSFFEGHVALGLERGRVVVYAGSDDNLLYKVDDAGRQIWTYDTDASPAGVIWTKPMLTPDGRTVVIGDLSGQVHAVDTATGRRRWAVRLGGAVVSSPALGWGGEIVVAAFDGKVSCLSAVDGAVLWEHQTLGLVYSSPAIDADGDVVIGSTDGGLYRFDRFGRRRWTWWAAGPIKSSPVLDGDGNAYVGCESGALHCIGADGRRRWSIDTDHGAPANPVNASPSLAADGTVYVGTTTGRVVAVPAGWCEAHPDRPEVSLDPGDDGSRPDVPPGGATLVPLDREGTPQWGEGDPVGCAGTLNLSLVAVDEAGDVVEGRLRSDGLEVSVHPEVPVQVRVESMGRFLYVLPDALLEPATTYEVSVRARYDVGDATRVVERTVAVTTVDDDGGSSFPLRGSADAVDAVVLAETRVAQPKEIDALGQAMIDSQSFVVAPLAVDAGHGTVVAAVCWVQATPEGYAYRSATTNKGVFAGRTRGGWFHLDGEMHLVAQGINIPFDGVRFSGRARHGRVVDDAAATLIAPTAGIVDFADLIRVMDLADDHDDVVGFVTFRSRPFDSPATGCPEGVAASVTWDGRRVVAHVDAPGHRVADHWLHLTLWDPIAGRVLPTEVVVEEHRSGAPLTLSATCPDGVEPDEVRVVVGWDLHPLVVV